MGSTFNCFKLFRLCIQKLGGQRDAEVETDSTINPSPTVKPRRLSLRSTVRSSSTGRASRPNPPKIEIRKATLIEPSTAQVLSSTSQNDDAGSASHSKKKPIPSSSGRRNSECSSLGHENDGPRSRASSKGSATESPLKEQLRRGRRECPRRAHSFFIPKNILEELITVPAVQRDILARTNELAENSANEHAVNVCLYAKQLYAALAYIKRGEDIFSLLNEGVTDEVLPLTRRENDQGVFTLFRKSEDANIKSEPIQTCQKWSANEREKFDRVQWWMTAPFFEDKGHYELDAKTMLPFVPTGRNIEPMQGGYSEVYSVRLHPAHHDFWNTGPEASEPLIAVKKLLSPNRNEFEKERTILKTLGSKSSPHPHLIKLLASYRHKQKYHLMFPYADANLRKYWQDRKSPSFDEETVLWSMKQMTGIADALFRIHTFRVTIPLRVAGGKRLQNDAEMSVRPGEELFGRHGDIKPENILWFQSTPECADPKGILQVADFGLGRFHGRDSRSKVNPDTVLASPTYEPPECKLRRPVSRAYDIWSMACLYLEFITWLLKGSAEIDHFADFRGRLSSININDDNFFTVTRNNITGPDAAVRESVIEWVNNLHQHEKASALIHDLLDLIMGDLLLIDSKARCEAAFLFQQMEMYLKIAEGDREYMLKPVPPYHKRKSGGRAYSTSNVAGTPKPTPSRYSSAKQDIVLPLPSLPKSVNLNPDGTIAIKKRKSVTWPAIKSTPDDDCVLIGM